MMSLTYWSCLNFFAEKTLYTLFYLKIDCTLSCNLIPFENNALTLLSHSLPRIVSQSMPETLVPANDLVFSPG
jgi:hypothetical protein